MWKDRLKLKMALKKRSHSRTMTDVYNIMSRKEYIAPIFFQNKSLRAIKWNEEVVGSYNMKLISGISWPKILRTTDICTYWTDWTNSWEKNTSKVIINYLKGYYKQILLLSQNISELKIMGGWEIILRKQHCMIILLLLSSLYFSLLANVERTTLVRSVFGLT